MAESELARIFEREVCERGGYQNTDDYAAILSCLRTSILREMAASLLASKLGTVNEDRVNAMRRGALIQMLCVE